MLVVSNADPVVEYVAINSTGYLGVPPQIPPAGFNGSPSLLLVNLLGQTNLVLSGNVGPANGGLSHRVREVTNVALPLIQWSVVATNVFSPDGGFSNLVPIMPGTSQQFYRLQVPCSLEKLPS